MELRGGGIKKIDVRQRAVDVFTLNKVTVGIFSFNYFFRFFYFCRSGNLSADSIRGISWSRRP